MEQLNIIEVSTYLSTETKAGEGACAGYRSRALQRDIHQRGLGSLSLPPFYGDTSQPCLYDVPENQGQQTASKENLDQVPPLGK